VSKGKAQNGGLGESRRRVDLLNPNGYSEAKARRFRPWIDLLVADLAEGSSLAVRFVGDRAMQRLNRDFRGCDSTTDVLSFPGEESPEGRHLGDIAVSVPAARRQARVAGHSVGRELRVLLLHGVLHCLGYDHETDAGDMFRLEGRLRRKWVDRDV
jgi:probable rRNA maturation factor